MRKNYFGVIILTAVLFAVGCNGDKGTFISLKIAPDMTLLKIERCLARSTNPVLVVLAKKVSFDYNQRIVIIEGVINIASKQGGCIGWVVPEVCVRDNSLVINIPTDSDYNVQIGGIHFYLPNLPNTKYQHNAF